MNRKSIRIFLYIAMIVGAIVTLLFCASLDFNIHIPVLFPKGWVGVKEKDLLVDSTLIMLIVVVPVFIMTCVFSWKYRAGKQTGTYRPNWDNSWVAEAIWTLIPCVIIVVLSVLVWKSSYQLDPFRPLKEEKKPVSIQVVALPWRWLFIYPEQSIATINYIKIPQNTPVAFDITADAPMNSFWIPELGGQVFAMPGMKTKLHLIANHQGSFFGTSANLSGKGFAKMVFRVQSVSQQEFDSWVHDTQHGTVSLTHESYKDIARPSEEDAEQSFVLKTPGLFDWVFMSYMMPMEKKCE